MLSRLIPRLAAVLLIPSAFAVAEIQPNPRQWQVDGVAREALVYVPAEAKNSPCPVVFAFHGHGGTMRNAAQTFHYHTLWPEALVVYMQGLNTPGRLTDLEGKKPGWQHGVGAQVDRDLKFFDTVLASLKSEYRVDESRIYSTGHSNGGGFTYLLWGNRGDVFAAVAPSAATPGTGEKALKPKPALHLAGENDPLVKYAWQEQTIELVRELNHCVSPGKPWAQSGKLVGTLYESPSGTPFITLIHPGAHQFPAEAPALIVKFFKEHVKSVEASRVQ